MHDFPFTSQNRYFEIPSLKIYHQKKEYVTLFFKKVNITVKPWRNVEKAKAIDYDIEIHGISKNLKVIRNSIGNKEFLQWVIN